jgi:hypothetical protein
MRNLMFIALALALAVFLCTDAARAQATGSTVTGIAKDTAGNPVVNITITLENAQTGQRMTATTDSDGRYRFDNVPVGQYRVVTQTPQGVMAPSREFGVQSGQVTTVTLTVSTAAAGTTTPLTDGIVTAEPEQLYTIHHQITGIYNTQYNEEMPQSNFATREGEVYGGYNLNSSLEPGITNGGIGLGLGPAAAGQRPEYNLWRIDGMDNNNKTKLGAPLNYMSNMATQESHIFQNQFEPVFAQTISSRNNLIAGGGTNNFHGTFYNFLQNRNFNAMPTPLSRMGLDEHPRHDQNRLGGQLGFPILPSRIFFFGNFEYIPYGFTRPVGPPAFAPTQQGFTALSGMPGVSATNLGILQDVVGGRVVQQPFTTTTVNGTTVPLGAVNNLVSGWQNSYMGSGAVDINATSSDQLRLRYFHNHVTTSNDLLSVPSFDRSRDHYSLLGSLGYYKTFSPSIVNELRLGYNRWHQDIDPFDQTLGGLDTFPNLTIGGSNLMFGPQGVNELRSIVNTYQLSDSLKWNFRSHDVSIGFDGLRTIGSQSGFGLFRGNYFYSSLGRFLMDLPPDVVSSRAFGNDYWSGNQWLLGAWLQDRWRVTPSLTLNLGVRYQYATVPDQLKRQSLNAAASIPGMEFRSPAPDTANFAPNVGFAWSPGDWMNRKWVVRGGFGMAWANLYSSSNFAGLPVAPQLGTIARGNLLAETPGFLTGGGLQPPAGFGSPNLTEQQARAMTSVFVPRQKLPYAMQVNFGIQTELWRNANIDLKYLGSRTVHLPVLQQLNAVSPVTADRSLPIFFQQPSQAELNALTLSLNQLQAGVSRPLAASGFTGPIMSIAPDGNSWYNGLAARFSQDLAGGVQAIGAYTWSNMIDDSTGTFLDLAQRQRQKHSSLYDRRHRFSLAGVFDVEPLFRDYSVVKHVFANFKLAGTYTYQSEQYLPLISPADVSLTGVGPTAGAFFNPNARGMTGTGVSALRNSTGQTVGYLANNPNARFVAAAPGVFTDGLHARVPMDVTNNFDVTGIKEFSYRDRFGFQIRADALNLFNHPQYTGAPINTLSRTPIGSVPITLLSPGGFGFADPSQFFDGNSRVLQLALRITF